MAHCVEGMKARTCLVAVAIAIGIAPWASCNSHNEGDVGDIPLAVDHAMPSTYRSGDASVEEVPRVYYVCFNERFPPGYPLDRDLVLNVYPAQLALLKDSLAHWTANAYCALRALGLDDEQSRLLLQFYEQFDVALIAEDEEEFTIEVCAKQASGVKGEPLRTGVYAPVYIEDPPGGAGETELIRIRLPSFYLQTQIKYYEHMMDCTKVYEDIPMLLDFYYSDMDDRLPRRISVLTAAEDCPIGIPLLLREGDSIWCLMVAQ